ncbi:MAG: glycosyltransferase [Thermoleophilaceae bacterium]|nr:glycosyltransferase [Thermoleophilaceae bacterium]
MKVAILYDCMFPYTVGGGERWYVNLSERLSERYEVTYVTLKQWEDGHKPDVPFGVITVGPGMELYNEDGRRKIGPPLRYGFGVFLHLLRHGGKYDIVHSSAFPYFSVIGAKFALLFHPRTKLVVDWLEVWSRDYWRDYLGAIGGRVGFAIQQFCARLPDYSFAISKLHADRLPGNDVIVNTGLVGEMVDARRPAQPAPAPNPPRAVFAGRQIPEKNVIALPAAVAVARETLPDLTMTIFGDGPERDALLAEIEHTGTGDAIDTPGFVDAELVHEGLRTASCMVLPSIREGYGLVVIEALSQGTPAVVVAAPDNAAAEFIEPGLNGYIAESASPEQLGAAIVSAVKGGDALRASSWKWYDDHAVELSIDGSIAKIVAVYEQATR